MAKGKPREDGLSSLEGFFDEQVNRIFDRLWVTVPHGHPHVSPNERKLREDRARRLSESLAEEADIVENRK